MNKNINKILESLFDFLASTPYVLRSIKISSSIEPEVSVFSNSCRTFLKLFYTTDDVFIVDYESESPSYDGEVYNNRIVKSFLKQFKRKDIDSVEFSTDTLEGQVVIKTDTGSVHDYYYSSDSDCWYSESIKYNS